MRNILVTVPLPEAVIELYEWPYSELADYVSKKLQDKTFYTIAVQQKYGYNEESWEGESLIVEHEFHNRLGININFPDYNFFLTTLSRYEDWVTTNKESAILLMEYVGQQLFDMGYEDVRLDFNE